MLVLLFCSILGLLISFVIHICAFLSLFHPAKILVMALNIGIWILFLSGEYFSKRIKKGIDKKEFRKSAISSCPYWLWVTAGIIIIYGTIMLIFSLVGAFSVTNTTKNSEIALDKFYRGYSALMMAIYALEFSLLYCYRKLWKAQVYDDASILKLENTNIEL